MKYYVLLASIMLAACAHTRVRSWEGNKFTVCGNRWAHQADYQKAAADRCMGSYRALAGGESLTGDMVTQSDGYGNGTVRSKKEYCTVYECSGH